MEKLLFIIFVSYGYLAPAGAQDTVARRNRLSDSMVEHFYVLKSNTEIKQGPYAVLLRRRILLVRGHYKNGEKNGSWQFFDTQGRLSEKYDYDKKRFTFEAPVYSSRDFSYLFDDSLKKGDRLTRPLKIGGIYFGFVAFVEMFRMPFETFDIYTNTFEASIELLISPLGQLAGYGVRLRSFYYGYEHIFKFDVNLFSKADRVFKPATLNDVPVMSRIIIRCYVNGSGGLDFY